MPGQRATSVKGDNRVRRTHASASSSRSCLHGADLLLFKANMHPRTLLQVSEQVVTGHFSEFTSLRDTASCIGLLLHSVQVFGFCIVGIPDVPRFNFVSIRPWMFTSLLSELLREAGTRDRQRSHTLIRKEASHHQAC
eukprot:TRINITY_DN20590_c0_g2_i1.p1 TRINITY_DN20590_c0_g2~~TRINITY_DN20590_c0_g2_i1.p1  ORF type:complete len:153 (+),score=3.25 TRINITY_DN20590_c0_g2_i1:48-461(+)